MRATCAICQILPSNLKCLLSATVWLRAMGLCVKILGCLISKCQCAGKHHDAPSKPLKLMQRCCACSFPGLYASDIALQGASTGLCGSLPDWFPTNAVHTGLGEYQNTSTAALPTCLLPSPPPPPPSNTLSSSSGASSSAGPIAGEGGGCCCKHFACCDHRWWAASQSS